MPLVTTNCLEIAINQLSDLKREVEEKFQFQPYSIVRNIVALAEETQHLLAKMREEELCREFNKATLSSKAVPANTSPSMESFEALPAHDPNPTGGHASIGQQDETDETKFSDWYFIDEGDGVPEDLIQSTRIQVRLSSGSVIEGKQQDARVWTGGACWQFDAVEGDPIIAMRGNVFESDLPTEDDVRGILVADSPEASGTSADETARDGERVETIIRPEDLDHLGEQDNPYSPIHEDNPDADGIDLREKEDVDA